MEEKTSNLILFILKYNNNLRTYPSINPFSRKNSIFHIYPVTIAIICPNGKCLFISGNVMDHSERVRHVIGHIGSIESSILEKHLSLIIHEVKQLIVCLGQTTKGDQMSSFFQLYGRNGLEGSSSKIFFLDHWIPTKS